MESTMEKKYTTEGTSSEMCEMTVYRALSLRKIYADRLEKLKENATSKGFVKLKKQSAMADTEEIKTITNDMKSKYDETMSLFRNFYALNSAIQQSNATTKVTIAGKEYTVAEAISRYDRINAEINFYNGVAKNVAEAVAKMESDNTDLLDPKKIETYLNNTIKSLPEGIVTTEEEIRTQREKLKETYISENTVVMIDPYNLRGKIEGILKELHEFCSEFNEMLNTTNLITKISVNLVKD